MAKVKPAGCPVVSVADVFLCLGHGAGAGAFQATPPKRVTVHVLVAIGDHGSRRKSRVSVCVFARMCVCMCAHTCVRAHERMFVCAYMDAATLQS